MTPMPLPLSFLLLVALLTFWTSAYSALAFQTSNNNNNGFARRSSLLTPKKDGNTQKKCQIYSCRQRRTFMARNHLSDDASCNSHDSDNSKSSDKISSHLSESFFLNTRRQAIMKAITKTTMATVAATNVLAGIDLPPSHAANVRAPIECLLPATRAKLYIDGLVNACKQVSSLDEKLEQQLFQPPIFIKTEEEMNASQMYKQIQTQSSWNKARRSEREQRGAELGIDYTTPYDKINTAIQEYGDRRQFRTLRKRQVALDNENPMRAALNSYTNNLVFSDSYQLNAMADEKKNMVRNNALPNVNSVVVSDLDLRDLIRNQILQNVDDARAEWIYQQKEQQEAQDKGQKQEPVDIQEILNYLLEAQKSCNEWFDFIPAQDIKTAVDIVLIEES